MTGTILTYLEEYGKISFRERPFQEVDSLILCQLAYLKFDGLVPGPDEKSCSVMLRDLAGHPNAEELFTDSRYERVNRELFHGLIKSKRFGELSLNYYVNLIENEWETQFSAITCRIGSELLFIAFRGTDENLIGWKEDFNMAFQSPVPAQVCSVTYLEKIASYEDTCFYVGGHSKGGNLAVYSAMCCNAEIRDRILRIYSMDGPGIRPEKLKECGYERIADRVVKILPHSSLIGMLFEQNSPCLVVESKRIGLLQHDPFSWVVEDGHFVEVRDVNPARRRMDRTLNKWLLSLDTEHLRCFVEAVFTVLYAAEKKDLIEMENDRKRALSGMLGAVKELDPGIRKKIREAVYELFEIAGKEAIREAGRCFEHTNGKDEPSGK